MKTHRICVVGGMAAGPSAAAKAARVRPSSEVIMFESTETISYGICEAPYAVAGTIADERTLVAYTPERLREEKGVIVKTLHRVEKISPSTRTLVARDLRRRETVEMEYANLIIATGAEPNRLHAAGEDARNVFHVGTRADTLNILGFIDAESPREAVIIGGGYIGMEMAEALRTRGMEVTLIHRHRLPMAGLEQEVRERVLDELEANGVHVVTNARTESLHTGPDGRVAQVVTNRGSFASGCVILSLGVRPNVALVKKTGIRLGKTGGILTDERQQTSVDHIYAAGDCCEVRNAVSGRPMYLPLATLASRAGWVAGENAAGGHARFTGAIRAIAVKVFGIEVAQVGLSADEARDVGFQVFTERITAPSRVALMPGAGGVALLLIVDKRTGRLLGANAWGVEGSVQRANALGIAIQHKMTVDDIARFDMIYAPPFAPLWDPVLVAANQARKKLAKLQ